MTGIFSEPDIHIYEFDFKDNNLIDETITLLNEGSVKKKHNREFWDWRFNQNPFGKSMGWYAKDVKQNRMAGVLLWWPWNYTAGNKKVPFYQAINGKTGINYRNLGIFYKLNNVAIEYFRKENISLCGFPNEQSYPSYKKLGWDTVTGVQPVYITGNLINIISRRLSLKRKSIDDSSDVNLQAFRFDSHNNLNVMFTQWSEEIFLWRFKMHPIHKYHFYIETYNFFVYRIKKRAFFNEAQIVYSHLQEPDKTGLFIRYLNEGGIDFISYFGYNTELIKIFERRFFKYRRKKALYFVVDDTSGFKGIPFKFEMAETDSQ